LDDQLKKNAQVRIDQIMDNPNYQERAEKRKQIEAEEEEKKKKALEELNKEKAEKLEKEKEAIRNKFLAGA
jgi:hypothetical protein